VVLGDGATTLTAGTTFVIDGGDPGDTLTVTDHVTLQNLTTSAINTVTLGTGSRVSGFVTVWGGFNAPNTLTLSGRVDQSVFFGGSGGVDTLLLDAGASIGGNLLANLFGGNDSVTLKGNIGGSRF